MNRNFRITSGLIFVFVSVCLAMPLTAHGQRVKKKTRPAKKASKVTTVEVTTAQPIIVTRRPGRPVREGIDTKLIVPNTLRIAIDYDHDGRADYVVFNPATNNWQIVKSSGGTVDTPFGF